jgi:hypothetical protein
MVRARLPLGHAVPARGERVWLGLVGSHTCYYDGNEELVA